MRTRTRWRASSALWVLPIAMTVVLFFHADIEVHGRDHGYAPTLVARPLRFIRSLAYATVSGLAAWQSGRLRQVGVWALAPARSPFRVAADALTPVVVLGWLMPTVPVCLSLAAGGSWPTPGSLPPLLLGMLLCCAHAVIGFAAGLRVPPVIAAPAMTVLVWPAVAMAPRGSTLWWRYIAGANPDVPLFGEGYLAESFVAQALPTCALAVAAALLWVRVGLAPVRLVAGVTLVAVRTVTARSLVEDYGYRAPTRYGLVAMRCAGTAPEVRVPEATVRDIEAVRAEVTAAVEDLAGTGIAQPPRLVTDSTAEGLAGLPSAADTWRTGLTRAARRGEVRAEVMRDAIDVPCRGTRAGDTRPAVLWLGTRMGLPDPYANGSDPRFDRFRTLGEVRATVADALEPPPDDQLAWYHAQLAEACRTGDRWACGCGPARSMWCSPPDSDRCCSPCCCATAPPSCRRSHWAARTWRW